MPVKKIEALVDAFAKLNGAFNDPESEAYNLRNPLMIKSYGLPGKHQIDGQGRRVFDSMLSGYRAGLFDLEIKLSGKSRAKLSPDDKLENLLRVYGITELGGVKQIVNFLRRALKDQEIQAVTPLRYFLE
jgi:hypothetical protein